jgi:hypothetical protein
MDVYLVDHATAAQAEVLHSRRGAGLGGCGTGSGRDPYIFMPTCTEEHYKSDKQGESCPVATSPLQRNLHTVIEAASDCAVKQRAAKPSVARRASIDAMRGPWRVRPRDRVPDGSRP